MFNYTSVDESSIEFVEIAPASELPSREKLFVEIADRPIVIINIAGQLFAIGDVCSHDDGPVGDVDLDGYNITCPRHGAEFDVRTGKVMTMPAVVDIPAYPVHIRDGSIYRFTSVAFLPNNQMIIAGPVDGSSRNWNINSDTAIWQTPYKDSQGSQLQPGGVKWAAVSADGTRVALLSEDGSRARRRRARATHARRCRG